MVGLGRLDLRVRKRAPPPVGGIPCHSDKLTALLDGVLMLFAVRILSYDTNAARCYADLGGKRT